MVLIVGADGFLGSRLRQALETSGVPVRAATRPGRGGDITTDLRSEADLGTLLDVARGAVVYYCANVGGPSAGRQQPQDTYHVNAAVPGRLSEVAQRIVYFSTDYVFSGTGRKDDRSDPCPDGTYGESKLSGERAVLAAAPSRSLVVRVSGLYDEGASRAHNFATAGRITAADNRVSTPTCVPDLISSVTAMERAGEVGVRHVVGAEVLSPYEFLQLAAARWGFGVEPVVDDEPSSEVTLVPSPGSAVQSVPEVFFPSGRGGGRSQSTDEPVTVFDCVGVVLAGRRWRKRETEFWTGQEAWEHRTGHLEQAEDVAGAYAPNPYFWKTLSALPSSAPLILANNGPLASFSLWERRYGFHRLFDLVINSERDGISKPDPAFFAHIRRYAGDRRVRLVDDREEIVCAALAQGWDAVLSKQVRQWPVEEYRWPGHRP